jgi:geranylgeranyl pyrophosphate synthase
MVSNLLIPHAISLVKIYGFKAVNKVIEVWWEISKGEIWDIHGPPSIDDPFKAYERIIEAKTASLFALASYLGALAAGNEEVLEDAWNYGFILGKAYQIADDLIDYSTDNTFSSKLFNRWITNVGREGVIGGLKKLILEAEKVGKRLGSPLDKFPKEGVSMLLGFDIE